MSCGTTQPRLIEPPLPDTVIIPPLPDSLQESCPTVIPRIGKDARVELYRALVTLEHCSALGDEKAQFYNSVRAAQMQKGITP